MTFAQAKINFQAYLLGIGWKMSDPFKVSKIPYFTSPDGRVRIWFKPQAVYYTSSNLGHHAFGNARSIHADIRRESPESIVAWAHKFAGY